VNCARAAAWNESDGVGPSNGRKVRFMRLEPLYLLTFRYPEQWGVGIDSDDSPAGYYFFIAEGRCTGRITGRFRAANHPMRRTDGTFLPDLQGVIETADGATIVLDMRGYGRAYPLSAREVVVSLTHVSDDPRYRHLNDTLSVGCGEVRRLSDEETELVVDVRELVWEPLTTAQP
jgi:hypothetical protein